jgi:dTDP-4-dehydrorhamnose reductase
MAEALVGYTGFVGSNLLRQHAFDRLYNSRDIQDIHGQSFSLLVWSGTRAEKWRANQNPEADKTHVDELIEHLRRVSTDVAVLISTVDVYPDPRGFDERTDVSLLGNHPYGYNRARLEAFFREHFSKHLIVRLPALYGQGLKKNIVFDLLNDNETHKIDSRGVFQFYNVDWIWADIQRCLKEGLYCVNFTTEPVAVEEVTRFAFGRSFKNEILLKFAEYDFKSIHSQLWGRHDGYLHSKQDVLEGLKAFVSHYSRKET